MQEPTDPSDTRPLIGHFITLKSPWLADMSQGWPLPHPTQPSVSPGQELETIFYRQTPPRPRWPDTLVVIILIKIDRHVNINKARHSLDERSLSCLDFGPQLENYVPGGEGSDFADCNPESSAEARTHRSLPGGIVIHQRGQQGGNWVVTDPQTPGTHYCP